MGLYPDYPIRTERLLLRPLELDDTDAIYAYQSLPEQVRYVPYEPRSRDDVVEMITKRLDATKIDEPPGVLPLAVVLRETGELIGDVVLMWHSAEHRAGEIGYILNPAYSGHGYVTEAMEAMLRLGFEDAGMHRITARLDARNERSAGVARRLGMRQEAHLRANEWFKGEWTDEIVFAMLEDEWRQRQARA